MTRNRRALLAAVVVSAIALLPGVFAGLGIRAFGASWPAWLKIVYALLGGMAGGLIVILLVPRTRQWVWGNCSMLVLGFEGPMDAERTIPKGARFADKDGRVRVAQETVVVPAGAVEAQVLVALEEVAP